VTCAACGAENRAAARFCDGCGAKLVAPAAPPGSTTEPRSYTPPHLAERILRSRSALEGERKQVTVMFADVRESMQLAESLGIEVWHATLDRFFQLLAGAVHRFEGTINQYTGDGVMALFGAPLALEDHAERACACALELREPLRQLAHELRREHGVDFAVRVGLHSGEVVVGKIGDDLRMDYTAQGPVVGTAQRIEQLAEAGRPYLSEATARLVEGFFALEDQGELTLRGVRGTLRVFALDGPGPLRSRLERARRRGFSRFVGRERELSVLEAAVTRSRDGASRFAIVGEAGSGKSRLCHELCVRAGAARARIVSAHCVARSDVPLAPVRELLGDLIGLRDGDESLEARRKIAGALLLAEPGLQPALPGIFAFFGVPDPAQPAAPAEPGSLEPQLVHIATLLLRAAAEREMVVVVIEDLHWCDALSEAVFVRLHERGPARRLLWLENTRPGASPALLRGAEALPLAPLTEQAVDELLDDQLGREPTLSAVKGEIRERAAGNPFFVEELVLTLVESGALVGPAGDRSLGREAARAALPATVQAVLATRIDRLSDSEKALLCSAAVIGRDVPEALLRELAGLDGPSFAHVCSRLEDAELLLEVTPAPQRLLRFKHPLTQEVAYGSQLAAARARTHAAVAGLLARDAEAAPEALAALVSHHFEAAGEIVAAARWEMRAALAAEPHGASHAAGLWRRAYDSLSALPPTPDTEALALEAACGALCAGFYSLPATPLESLVALCDAARVRAERLGSSFWRAALHAHTAALAHAMRHLDLCRRHSDTALELAEEARDPDLLAAIRGRLSYTDMLSRGPVEALRRTERALAETPDLELAGVRVGLRDNPRLRLSSFRAYALMSTGRLAEALPIFREAYAEACERRQLTSEFSVLIGLSALHRVLGEGEAAIEVARIALARARAVESPYWRNGATFALAFGHAVAGDWRAVLATVESAIAMHAGDVTSRALRAESLWRTGAVAEARALLREIEPLLSDVRGQSEVGLTFRFTWQISLARVVLALDGAPARARVEHYLDLASERPARDQSLVGAAYVALERAELARVLGDEAGWRSHLESARRGFASGPAPRMVADVDQQLARGFAATSA
jgi:class 3 adenylate cyclase/tetratricopeptide (TPR) repeat protein